MTSLASLARPNSVSIFADDPTTRGRLAAFVLTNAIVPSKSRVRLDLTTSGGVAHSYALTRNPIEQSVVTRIRREPERLAVSGTLSATPLGLGAALGQLHSIVRLDLKRRDALVEIANRCAPVIVVCPWGVYDSMGIETLTEDHPGSEKVDLTITFSKILIVSELLVEVTLDLDTILAGAPTDAQLGSQAVESVPAPSGLPVGGLG
jgi:hypothetical protein